MIEIERVRRVSVDDIGLTPLIDVVFQLLLFFALSLQFDAARGMKVNLPEAATSEMNQFRGVVVTVAPDGRYVLDGRDLDESALVAAIRLALEGANSKVVRIEADEIANVGPAVRALDAARIAGADAATLATRPPGSPGGASQ